MAVFLRFNKSSKPSIHKHTPQLPLCPRLPPPFILIVNSTLVIRPIITTRARAEKAILIERREVVSILILVIKHFPGWVERLLGASGYGHLCGGNKGKGEREQVTLTKRIEVVKDGKGENGMKAKECIRSVIIFSTVALL